MTELLTIALGFLSYAFVILSIFRLFRINYFNPIVKIFTTYLEPLSKSVFFFLTPLLAAIVSALSLKFFSYYLVYSSGHEPLTLFYISIINIVNSLSTKKNIKTKWTKSYSKNARFSKPCY